MQSVADDQSHTGKRWVQPIDRGLAILEIVKVDPATFDTIGAQYRAGDTPVGLLDPFGVEDDALQAADDVAGLVEPILGRGVDVDRIDPGRHFGKMLPVARVDLD